VDILRDFGGVDVDVYNLGVWRERLYLAGRTVVETDADADE